MNKRQPTNNKPALPTYIRCCAGCANKLEHFYRLIETDEEDRPGRCPLCQNVFVLSKYQLKPIRFTYTKRSGGGERARAESQ